MKANELITSDPDLLDGTPVFRGTRVPIKALFDYLANSLSLDYFLETFRSVTRELALGVLDRSRHAMEEKLAA